MFTRLLIVGFAAMLTGCQTGQWVPYDLDKATPGDHFEYSRSGKLRADLNSDTTLLIEGAEFERTGLGTGKAKVARLQLARNTSKYWAGVHQAQVGSNAAATIFSTQTLPAYAEAANGILDRTFVAALPLASQFIGGMSQVNLLNAQRQPAIVEIAKALNGPLAGFVQQQLVTAAPDLLAEAQRLLSGMKPISLAPANPIDAQTLTDIGKPKPATNLPPRRAVKADDLTPAELPVLPSRDDVRREFALSEVVQAGLPETELVRFK